MRAGRGRAHGTGSGAAAAMRADRPDPVAAAGLLHPASPARTAIVGTFLASYAEGKPLLAALRAVRPEAPGHSVAQSLRRGFLARGGRIRAYLARLRARALEPTPTTAGPRGQVSVLLGALCVGFAKAAEAFVHHGVGLHAMQQIGLS